MSATAARPVAAQPAALEAVGLTVRYGRRTVFDGLDLTLPPTSLNAVVGPNGAGKSTLVKAALGLVPSAGRVRLLGEPLGRVRPRVAYLPQHDAVTPDFPITAVEVVEMGRFPHRGWWRRLRRTDDDAVVQAMERIGVSELANEALTELSGGQRQRVFLARALAQDADLLVLDEPFAAVDARTGEALLTVLVELTHIEGRSVVVVHHDLRTVHDRFDHATLLAGGLLGSGPVASVLTPELLEQAYGVAPLRTGDYDAATTAVTGREGPDRRGPAR